MLPINNRVAFHRQRTQARSRASRMPPPAPSMRSVPRLTFMLFKARRGLRIRSVIAYILAISYGSTVTLAADRVLPFSIIHHERAAVCLAASMAAPCTKTLAYSRTARVCALCQATCYGGYGVNVI